MFEDLIREIQRLRVADDEVLVVRPKMYLSPEEKQRLHANLARVLRTIGLPSERVVVLDRELDLTVVKVDQLEL